MDGLEKLAAAHRACDAESRDRLSRFVLHATAEGDASEAERIYHSVGEALRRASASKKQTEETVISEIAELTRIPENRRAHFRARFLPILRDAYDECTRPEITRFKNDEAFISAAEKVRAARGAVDGLSDEQRNLIFSLLQGNMGRRLMHKANIDLDLLLKRMIDKRGPAAIAGIDPFDLRHLIAWITIGTLNKMIVGFLPLMMEAFTQATGKNLIRHGKKGALKHWAFRHFILELRQIVKANGGRLPLDEKDPDGSAKFKAAVSILEKYLVGFVPNPLPVKNIAEDWRKRP
jgi:hypothetical protein